MLPPDWRLLYEAVYGGTGVGPGNHVRGGRRRARHLRRWRRRRDGRHGWRRRDGRGRLSGAVEAAERDRHAEPGRPGRLLVSGLGERTQELQSAELPYALSLCVTVRDDGGGRLRDAARAKVCTG